LRWFWPPFFGGYVAAKGKACPLQFEANFSDQNKK
jgi:hypothetical protein